MIELFVRIAIVLLAVTTFYLVHFVHGYLLDRQFPLIGKKVRWSAILLQIATLMLGIVLMGAWFAVTEPSIGHTMVFIALVGLLALAYFLQFWPGADLEEEGIIFRRFYGRKVYVRWRDILASRLTWRSSLLRIETSDGRRLGLQVVNRGIWTLWDELIKRNIPSPSEEELKAAIERQTRANS